MSDETTTPQSDDAPDTEMDGADSVVDQADGPEDGEDNASSETQEPSLAELQVEFERMRDHMLRAVAEADNTRKRAEREIADSRAYAVTSFARDLLSVTDNLSRALSTLPENARDDMSDAVKNMLAGVEITEKELQAALQRNGVLPIDVYPGAKFDPNLHQAAAQIPSEYASGTVAAVVQSGWVIGDRVLRASMVAISSGPAAAPPPSSPGEPSDGQAANDGPAPGSNVDTKI